MSTWLDNLSTEIHAPKRIVFPEGEEEAVIRAAYQAYLDKICLPFLIGNHDTIKMQCHQLNLPTDNWWTDLDPEVHLTSLLTNNRIQTLPIAQEALSFLLADPLFFGMAYLKAGLSDSLVAGYNYTTAEVVTAGKMFLSKSDGSSLPSSYFVMDIPTFQGSEGSLLIFADCGVNIEPSPEEIAKIAMDTAQSAQQLLGWEARIALLSSSTNGSIEHESVNKMKEALTYVQKSAPTLKIDGELQGDTALSQMVAEKKLKRTSSVAGQANILVFPNLDAGNIAYKLTSQLAQAKAYGPLLQGLEKPIFDLSRGSSVAEIYGVIKIAAVFAEKSERHDE